MSASIFTSTHCRGSPTSIPIAASPCRRWATCGRLMAARCRPLVEQLQRRRHAARGRVSTRGVLARSPCCWRCPTAWPGDIWHYRLSLARAATRCCRQLGLGRHAALTGGLLFGENGALAWFAHSPPDPAVFLPWVLLGVERAAVQATLAAPRGWRLLGLATGLMLLAGFPETAYICGLLVVVWAVGRWAQRPPGARLGMIWRVALGGVVGLALCAGRKFSLSCNSCRRPSSAAMTAPSVTALSPRKRRFLLCSRPTHSGRSLPTSTSGHCSLGSGATSAATSIS